jgi:putative transposase
VTKERSSGYRKRVRHFEGPNHFHELTFSCFSRLPLLTENIWCLMLSDSISRAIQRHGFALVAFVYMPEHVHLLVFPQESASRIEQLLRAIKRPFSYRVKNMLTRIQSPLLGIGANFR